MPAIKIQWSLTLSVDGTPQPPISSPTDFTVDGYDVVKVTVPAKAGATDGTFDAIVQPNTAAGKVSALVITADKYDPGLSYADAAAAATDPQFALDGPHVFFGRGMIDAIANKFPTTLKFTNKTATPVAVRLFVGRQATA